MSNAELVKDNDPVDTIMVSPNIEGDKISRSSTANMGLMGRLAAKAEKREGEEETSPMYSPRSLHSHRTWSQTGPIPLNTYKDPVGHSIDMKSSCPIGMSFELTIARGGSVLWYEGRQRGGEGVKHSTLYNHP